MQGSQTDAATYGHTARIVVGNSDRACTGTLIDRRWVLTAKSCFADDPAVNNTVAAGAPKVATTVTVGRTDLTVTGGHTTSIVELVPREDRDLVMARLAQPAVGIAPVAVAADAPVAGETLTGAGFGRTKNSWVPDRLHAGNFRVDSTDTTTVGITGLDGATICKGDTGGPLLRQKDGTSQLVALHSRSWQGGCHGTDAAEVRTGAVDTRVDGLAGWVKDVISRDRTTPADIDGDGKADLVVQRTDGSVIVHRNLGGSFEAGKLMSAGWSRWIDGSDLGRLYFADITGDGKADMITHGIDGNIAVRKNTGTYFDGGTHWSAGWSRWVNGSDMGRLYFADITGDGKADMITHGIDGNIAVRKNTGTHFDGGTHWSAGWSRWVNGSDMGRLYFADITGDGKADMITHGIDGNIAVRKNTGTHFDGGTHWSAGWSRWIDRKDLGELRFGDSTGDGKADMFVYETATGKVTVRTNMGTYFNSGTLMVTL